MSVWLEAVPYAAKPRVAQPGSEFEAVNCGTTDEAIAVLLRYEALTGFDHLSRTNVSLFEMLLAESMPASLKKL